MKKSDIRTNLILITLLIISLVILNFSVSFIKAESAQNPEDIEADPPACEACGEEDTGNTEGEAIEQVEEVIGEEETIIETGDAEAEVDVDNEVNTNVTDLNNTEDLVIEEETASESEDLLGEEDSEEELSTESEGFEELSTNSEDFEDLASGSEELEEQVASGSEDFGEIASESGEFEEGETSVEVDNENDADIDNEIEGEVNTGGNETDDNNGDAIIETGDASAGANISNMVNTNITGSNFWFNFSNLFQDLVGDIHLNNFKNNHNNGCGLIDCVDYLRASNKNKGNIINDVEIYAVTGENSSDGNNGNAYIKTGNARVIANIANLLNTNITGSDWFFSILNNFSDWYGNLVLPGKETIENILNGNDSSGNDVYVENSSEADVENNVNTIAETGDNSADNNDEGSFINTGQAEAESNILNVINTNIFGDNWLVVGIKIFGEWTGEIHSLPDGVSWLRTPDGIILFNNDLGDILPGLGQEGEAETEGGREDTSLDIENDNEATLINNVDLIASTGDNSASNNDGGATIETGNALAIANIANFVNTNIIGRNWLFALVNIFGDWQGNLAFGQPNLWLGESAITSPNPASPGGTITYTLTYTNNGDADATGVILTDDFDENYLSVIDSGGGTVIDNPGEIQWDIGNVPIGGSGSVSYSVAITPEMPFGSTYLINHSLIESFEDDANTEDNVDMLSVKVHREFPGVYYIPSTSPELQVTKTSNGTDVVYAPGIIDYTITVVNPSRYTAYNVIVSDVLSNGDSEIINIYSWDLRVVYSGEEITIDYTVAIGPEVAAGFYTNTAEAEGVDGFGYQVISTKTSITIEVRESPFTEIAEEGEETETEEGKEVAGGETIEEGETLNPSEEGPGSTDIEEEIGFGISTEEVAEYVEEALEPESSGYKISLTEEEPFSEDEIPNRFFLAFVGDFFTNFGLMEILILLLIIAILFLILYKGRKKLENN